MWSEPDTDPGWQASPAAGPGPPAALGSIQPSAGVVR